MWLNPLPNGALQLTVDGNVVVLREEDQRKLLMHFARNHTDLFSEIVCPCCTRATRKRKVYDPYDDNEFERLPQTVRRCR